MGRVDKKRTKSKEKRVKRKRMKNKLTGGKGVGIERRKKGWDRSKFRWREGGTKEKLRLEEGCFCGNLKSVKKN